MARAAFKVFGVGGLLGVANVVSTPSVYDGSCADQKAVCDLEELCLQCMTAAVVINRNSPKGCSKYYPESETFCELLGTSYCCIFGDEAETQHCANDPTTADYWGCILGENGCGIESLLCFDEGGEGGGSENSQEIRRPFTLPGNAVRHRKVVQGTSKLTLVPPFSDCIPSSIVTIPSSDVADVQRGIRILGSAAVTHSVLCDEIPLFEL